MAGGLEEDVQQTEEGCERLARQHIFRPSGMASWPEGTVATRYEFTHTLYQQIAHRRLGTWRRVQLHRRIGMRPLMAHCHFGLGTPYRRIGCPEQAHAELFTAITLYHAMEMTFWPAGAEAELTQPA